MKAIVLNKTGGSENLQLQTIETPLPQANEISIKNYAIGINYIDIYQRTGLYKIPTPYILGREGAGIITDLGSEVKDFKIGDRVVYLSNNGGAYSETINAQSNWVYKIPDNISFEIAASSFLKGLTAHMLLYAVANNIKNKTIFIHAAAGGVGTILGRWAKALGATICAAAGSSEKLEILRNSNYDLLLNYKTDDIVKYVLAFTDDKGVDIVYDGVGADTFFKSAAMLKPTGLLVSYGQASGAVPEFSLNLLAEKSLFLTRPTVFHYLTNQDYFSKACKDLFEAISKDYFKPVPTKIYNLADVKAAHDDLENRRTNGSIILQP